MKFAAVALASIAALGLLSACGDDAKLTVPTTNVNAIGGNAPDVTVGDDSATGSIPTDLSVPQETIDLMIAQFEAAGMKVDKACFTALLSDEGLQELAASGGQGTPSPELTQKFLACMSTGG
ncbi:MAG: hypothetical protein ABI894_14925 [Ilumatobacteraceae bacterium]